MEAKVKADRKERRLSGLKERWCRVCTGVPLSKHAVGVLRSNNGVEENQWSTNGR